jgi:hypothetical protein
MPVDDILGLNIFVNPLPFFGGTQAHAIVRPERRPIPCGSAMPAVREKVNMDARFHILHSDECGPVTAMGDFPDTTHPSQIRPARRA